MNDIINFLELVFLTDEPVFTTFQKLLMWLVIWVGYFFVFGKNNKLVVAYRETLFKQINSPREAILATFIFVYMALASGMVFAIIMNWLTSFMLHSTTLILFTFICILLLVSTFKSIKQYLMYSRLSNDE